MQLKKFLPYILLGIALTYAVFRSMQAAMDTKIGAYTFWITLPYLLTGVVVYLLTRRRSYYNGQSVEALVVLFLTFLLYNDISSSSTSALTFAASPLYLTLIGPVLALIAFFVENYFARKRLG